jgi:hypothetical protein
MERTMRLLLEQSERVRHIVNVTLAEANLLEAELADELAPSIASATLYRILKTDQRMSIDQAEILIQAASRVATLRPDRLMRVVINGFDADCLPEYERSIATTIAADSPDVLGLVDLIQQAEAASQTVIALLSGLPAWILEEELAARLIDERVRRIASDPREAKHNIQDAIDRKREAFMTSVGQHRPSITLLVRLSGLVRLARPLAPFEGCEPDLIQSSFDSLVHDAIVERGLRLAVINDIAPGRARQWVWTLDEFPTIWLFGRSLLIKRRRGTLAFRVIDATSDLMSAAVLDHHASELTNGFNHVCHGLSQNEIVQFLSEFLVAAGQRRSSRRSMN